MSKEKKTQDDKLKEIQKKVENSYSYFRNNINRFNEFKKFIFDTSLSDDDIQKLQALGKPQLEFNILEAPISRLMGEFAKQEPSVVATTVDGLPKEIKTDAYIKTMQFVEDHCREIITDSAANDGLQYSLFKDLLGGGFTVVEGYTEYLNNMSFDQKIVIKRVYDPTLTGFDPLARESHKGDGNYCFQLYPKTKEDMEREFGKGICDEIRFARGMGDFSWSYSSKNEEIALICDFFEKEHKKKKIVKLSNGHVVLKDHYENQLLPEWHKRGYIEVPPIIIMERETEIETIKRVRLCENRILAEKDTDYDMLPLMFIDGNSIDIKDSESSALQQMTKPYAYNAKGIQRLKNFSGQTVGAEIENMNMHKYKVPLEAIPEKYIDAYRNPQQASVLVYNSFFNGQPEHRLDPPMEIQRTPTPPIVENTFMGSDRVTQAILGNYDSVMGTNEQDLSGVALKNGSIHTSNASTPYLEGYIKGLNRMCQFVVSMIPKYYVTPRSLPIRTFEGKRSVQVINDPNDPSSIDINYKSHELQVKVQAGVNTTIQKQSSLDQLTKMTQVSPIFAEFMNAEGLEIWLDNIEIRGIESLKMKAGRFMEAYKKAQQENANKKPPEIEVAEAAIQVEAAKVEQKQMQAEGELSVQAAKVAIEKQKVDAQVMQITNEIETTNAKLMLEQEKVDSENARTAVESAIDFATMVHKSKESKNENK